MMHAIIRKIAVVTTTLAAICSAHAADDALEKIKAKGSLSACYASYLPFAVKNPATNEWEGLNVDLGNEIAKLLNVKLVTVDTQWATLMQNLVTGKCDVAFAPFFVTTQRAEQILYSVPYATDSTAIFVQGESPISSFQELDKKGNIITVYAGTAEQRWAADNFKNAEVKALLSDTANAPILEVAAKRATATVASKIGNLGFMKNNPQFKLKLLAYEEINPAPFAFGIPKGEYHFQQYINIAIQRLTQNGSLKSITDKWMKQIAAN